MRAFIVIPFCLLFSIAAFAGGTVVDTSFYSQSLGFDRNVDVYLPDGYDPNGSLEYPAIYFLHGAAGNNNSYPEIITVLDTLIENQA